MMHPYFKRTVATAAAVVMISLPSGAAFAQDAERLSRLMDELANASEEAAPRIVREINLEWSKSGSAAMNLLLQRANVALENKQVGVAIEHLSALTDHAPDFAEGWQMLAVALFEQGRYGQSADALERALALNPSHFGAIRGLAAILERVGKPELAYRAFQKVLELNPHDAEVKQAVDRLQAQVEGTSL